MKLLIKTVAPVVLTIVIVLTYISRADAGGPWSNQYCNIETETIKTIDQNGNLVNEETKEKVVCDDGASDFLEGMGIAKNCKFFDWQMNINGKVIPQRSIACERLDGGGYEIVKGYHSIQ